MALFKLPAPPASSQCSLPLALPSAHAGVAPAFHSIVSQSLVWQSIDQHTFIFQDTKMNSDSILAPISQQFPCTTNGNKKNDVLSIDNNTAVPIEASRPQQSPSRRVFRRRKAADHFSLTRAAVLASCALLRELILDDGDDGETYPSFTVQASPLHSTKIDTNSTYTPSSRSPPRKRAMSETENDPDCCETDCRAVSPDCKVALPRKNPPRLPNQ